jgi:hypothetical protein
MLIDKMLLSKRLVLGWLLMVAQPLLAQVKFTTVASSREVGRSDYVQLEFVVENAKEIEHFVPPDFPGFRVVQGPIQSSGMSIINGNMSQYKSLAFVLQPTRVGHFSIAGATATVDGKALRSNPVSIEVSSTGGGSNPVPAPSAARAWPGDPSEMDRDYLLKPGENVDDKIRKNLFVKVQVSKTQCYVGEPIVATYKLYSRLQSESRVSHHPSLNGFSVYDMVDPSRDNSSVEMVNGRPFTVHTIRKAQLIPLQAGTIELDPVQVDNTVHFLQTSGQRRHSSNSIVDLFEALGDEDLNGTPLERNITLESKPTAISVKALPEDKKPANFDGAVGQFSINANLEKKNLVAQDAATLTLTVKGIGNLPVLDAPTILWPATVESYDATEKENIDKSVAPLGGTKTFSYSFIPKVKGDYSIPAVSFSYFDPVSACYRTIQSAALSFRASAPKNRIAAPLVGVPMASTPEATGFVHFIGDHLTTLFAILILSAVAFLLGLQNWRLRKRSINTQSLEPQVVPQIAAVAAPKDPLDKSRALLASGDYSDFYGELNRAVWKALSEKLNLSSSQWNKGDILRHLQARGSEPWLINLVSSIFQECEMSLYTPNYNTRDMQLLLQDASVMLNELGKH